MMNEAPPNDLHGCASKIEWPQASSGPTAYQIITTARPSLIQTASKSPMLMGLNSAFVVGALFGISGMLDQHEAERAGLPGILLAGVSLGKKLPLPEGCIVIEAKLCICGNQSAVGCLCQWVHLHAADPLRSCSLLSSNFKQKLCCPTCPLDTTSPEWSTAMDDISVE